MNPTSQNTTPLQNNTLKISINKSGDLFDIQIKAKSSFFASHKHQSHDIIRHDRKPYVSAEAFYKKAPHFDINGHRLVPVLSRKEGKKVTAIDNKRYWKSLHGAVAYTRECNSDNVLAIVSKLADSGAVAIFADCYSGRNASIPVFTMSQCELEQIENLDRIGATVFLRRSHGRGKVLVSDERPALAIEGTYKLVQAIPRRSMFGRVSGIQNSKQEIKGATVTCSEIDLKPIQVVVRKLTKLGASTIMVTRDPGINFNSHVIVQDIRTIIERNNQHTEVDIKYYRKE